MYPLLEFIAHPASLVTPQRQLLDAKEAAERQRADLEERLLAAQRRADAEADSAREARKIAEAARADAEAALSAKVRGDHVHRLDAPVSCCVTRAISRRRSRATHRMGRVQSGACRAVEHRVIFAHICNCTWSLAGIRWVRVSPCHALRVSLRIGYHASDCLSMTFTSRPCPIRMPCC